MTEPDCPILSTRAAGLLGGLAGSLVAGEELDLVAPYELARAERPDELPVRGGERVALARGLELANASYGHPRAAELAGRLAEPGTAVVVTGQQTGFLGGPLLGLVKAAAAVRWAEAIERAGRPAVALFWMATEDHDFREVSELTVLVDSGPVTLGLGEDPRPLAPVGLRTIGPAVAPLLDELRRLEPSEWFGAELDRLAAIWRPEARFGEAFARTHLGLLGARAPLFLDSMLPELKAAQRPHLAALVERREELDAELRRREAALERRGLALQVAARPGASPLFLVRGGERRRIEWRGRDRWALRGASGEWPVAELLETIRDNPAAVSPGVLARPAVQDAVLSPTLFLVGPGEAAYLPQAAAAHVALGVDAPAISPRPHALVLDARARRRLAQLDATLEELLTRPEAIARRLAARAGAGFVEPLRAELLDRVESVRRPALALDPHLERPVEKTRGTIERALGRLAAKVAAAAARSDELASRRLEQLRALVRPNGAAQERVLSTVWLAGHWGTGAGERLLDALDLDPTRLSVVDPG